MSVITTRSTLHHSIPVDVRHGHPKISSKLVQVVEYDAFIPNPSSNLRVNNNPNLKLTVYP